MHTLHFLHFLYWPYPSSYLSHAQNRFHSHGAKKDFGSRTGCRFPRPRRHLRHPGWVQQDQLLGPQKGICMCIGIYLYIYVHTSYIYIYVYTGPVWWWCLLGPSGGRFCRYPHKTHMNIHAHTHTYHRTYPYKHIQTHIYTYTPTNTTDTDIRDKARIMDSIEQHTYDFIILGSGHRDGWASKLVRVIQNVYILYMHTIYIR